MKKTSGSHWVGVFLLFAASILLLFVTISAPVLNGLSLLHVTLPNGTSTAHSAVSFGTFGYCVLHTADGHDACTSDHIGYDPTNVIDTIDDTSFGTVSGGTSDALTRVMILHPIACGLAFLAFLTSLGAGILGSLTGALIAFVAWVLTLVVLATDFTLFGIVRHHVNHDGSGSKATFGDALWCLVAAFVALFFGMLIVLFTCCSARRERRRNNEVVQETKQPRKKRFGLF